MKSQTIFSPASTGRITPSRRKHFLMLAAGFLAGLLPLTSQGVLLNLSNTPLFLQAAVQPNVFLLVDDSGSMRWMTLYRDSTGVSNSTGVTNLTFNPTNSDERMRLCNGWNALAYDPTYTYTPWVGSDTANVTYQNAYLYGGGTEAAPNWDVRIDPFDPGTGTFNVSAVTVAYFPWNDANSNRSFNGGECGDTAGVKNDNTGAITWAAMTDTQRKNYANWYSYYRTRNYVLKRALTELIQNSSARVGLGTLWNHNGVGTQIANVDDITIPVNATNQTNKQTLMRNISRIGASSGTPLRDALDAAGQYYEGIAQTRLFGANPNHTGTVDALSPVLSAANGGACQQNFTILMTDGYYNNGYAGTNVANADGNSSSSFDSSNSGAGARPYGDNQSNTLGDIAMHYYERDLWPGLNNEVPTQTGVDENNRQHMVTYTVAFGLRGNAARDPFNETASVCDSDPRDACWVGWPNVDPATMEDTPDALDDLWHAAYNGRGKYLNARSAATLIQSLRDAIVDIGGRTGTASAVTVNAGAIYAGSRVYVPQFTSGRWSGSLLSKTFDVTGDALINLNYSGQTTNDAGEILRTTPPSSRTILTLNTNTNAGVPFAWVSLSAAQQTTLQTNAATLAVESVAAGQNRLEYLRGDHTNERPSGTLRERPGSFVLGSITDSSPVYVGMPDWGYPDNLESVPYRSFRYTYRTRTPIVYVGANDGMLHGFDANTGVERLAYVPASVYPRLSRLTDPGYSHAQFVNDTPTVTDVFYNSAWHTILVGSLRGGGQGIYALDVTNPSTFSEASAATIVRWEFTDANDADLGYTFSKPVVTRLRNGRYAAVFGNGYNNSEADAYPSGTGRAALYVVDIEDGSLIRKLTVPVGTVATPNGLATPTVIDFNGDRIADLVYAGDLQGNIWKFDIRDNDPTNWTLVGFSGANGPLFTATDLNTGGTAQPITSAPLVTRQPTGLGGFMVYFGSGKYIEGGGVDTSSTQTQTFYAVWDRQGVNTSVSYNTVQRSELRDQTLTSTTTGSGAVVRTSSNNPFTWAPITGAPSGSQRLGWRVNLNITRERVVSQAYFLPDDRILFFTIVPDTNPCSAGGTSWIMQLNHATGSSPADIVFDTDGDGAFTTADNASGSIVTGIQQGGIFTGGPVVQDSSGNNRVVGPTSTKLTRGGSEDRRQSWREPLR